MSEHAIRNPKRGKVHRVSWWSTDSERFRVRCSASVDGLEEGVPVEQVAPADLCRVCWKGRSL